MAYDNDSRSGYRDRDGREAPAGRNDGRGRSEQARGDRGGRGFFERAGNEVASWFGDEQAEQRREQDERSGRYDRPGEERAGSSGGWFGGRADADRDRQDRGG